MAPPSLLTSGKFYRLSIMGEIPPDLAALPPEQIQQAIMGGVSIMLGVTGTLRRFHFEILAQIPPEQGGN